MWQEDYYYSDILFPLFVRDNHQALQNIKLPVALDLKAKVIFKRQNVAFSKRRILAKVLNGN